MLGCGTVVVLIIIHGQNDASDHSDCHTDE